MRDRIFCFAVPGSLLYNVRKPSKRNLQRMLFGGGTLHAHNHFSHSGNGLGGWRLLRNYSPHLGTRLAGAKLRFAWCGRQDASAERLCGQPGAGGRLHL
jgi:hypothetical protein